jgi:eukaryotic translation initiation factor 2C
VSFLYFHPHTFIINEVVFYWLQVNLKYEDDTPVDHKGSGRQVIEKLQQTYAAELANKDFAYDCEKSLFTIGALPQVKNEFTDVVEDFSTGK